MPSIPQSLLWISLVVLWLFVLVPMLINKRDTVRRTSDLALSTRVLNGGAKSRLLRRRSPAAGHRHDPDWQAGDQFVEDYPEMYDETTVEVSDFAAQYDVIQEYDDAVREARMGARSRSVVVVAAVTERSLAETDYLDVDIVDENSGALPVGGTGVQASLFDTPSGEPLPEPEAVAPDAARPEDDAPVDVADDLDADIEADLQAEIEEQLGEPVAETINASEAHFDPTADEYEYIDDSSGLEADDESSVPLAPRMSNRQRRLSNATAAAVSARKYRFRKRVLMAMAALMILSAVLSFTVSPTLWWSCGVVAGVTVLYLGYLRRQTRIEEQVRRRRSQRMMRARPVADPMFEERSAPRGAEVDFPEFPTRLQRPGAVVLDIDDEDPIFEHLDEVPYSRRHYGMSRGMPGDLPRASGQ
jgi:hypothetical protein